MTARIEDYPVEVLSAIFACISFEQLHRNVKLVCKKWYSAVMMDYCHPRSMVIDGKNVDMAVRKILLYRPHVCRLEFSNIDSHIILEFFNSQFPRLKTLSIVWKWTSLSSACQLSATSLSDILDCCPKLDRLHLKNCILCESTGHLVEKIAAKRICRLSILNKYQFLDDVHRFYELKNMKELRISSSGPAETIQRACLANGASLTNLGVHIDAWSNHRVNALRSIGVCSQLVRLHISVDVQDVDAWTGLANLSKLRFLSIEVNRMPTKAFVSLFAGVGQLHSLKVRWNRRVELDELRCLSRLQLRRLSVAFVDDTSDKSSLVLAAVVNLIQKNYLLGRLRVETYFYDVDFLGWLCSSATAELRDVKIIQIFDSSHQKNVHYNLQRVSNLISYAYTLEYTLSESILEVVIKKKVQ